MGNSDQIPDINKMDFVRSYRLGTRFVASTGGRFQYGKIDFGIIGKDNGKVVRRIQYRWFPKNIKAAEGQVGFIY